MTILPAPPEGPRVVQDRRPSSGVFGTSLGLISANQSGSAGHVISGSGATRSRESTSLSSRANHEQGFHTGDATSQFCRQSCDVVRPDVRNGLFCFLTLFTGFLLKFVMDVKILIFCVNVLDAGGTHVNTL